MKFKIIIEVDGDKIIDVKTEKIDEVMSDVEKACCRFDDYSYVFGDGCTGWTKNPVYNKMFLLEQQRYFNDVLRAKGHLFLNEVYDGLGMPRTYTGQIVGWFYDEEDPNKDNFVDFGLANEYNRDFMTGKSRDAILIFNVDGNILDRL